MDNTLGIEGTYMILDKVVCPPCQEACISYIEQTPYGNEIIIPDVNKIYLVKQSGKHFKSHDCERGIQEEVADAICFCNAHSDCII